MHSTICRQEGDKTLPYKVALQDLVDNVDQAELFLSALSNAKRVLILCILLNREMSAGVLAKAVGLSQSSLSQHLATLRNLDLVATRRKARTIFYRVASPHIELMLSTLCGFYLGAASLPNAGSIAGRKRAAGRTKDTHSGQ